MAKKIIILEKTPTQNYFTVNYLFWLDVPVNQQTLRANQSLTSSFPSATAEELQNIKDGKVVEQSGSTSFNIDASNQVIAGDLQIKYANAQSALTNSNKYNYYGTYWDGSTWTIQGV